jgi:hypothetical protein
MERKFDISEVLEAAASGIGFPSWSLGTRFII